MSRARQLMKAYPAGFTHRRRASGRSAAADKPMFSTSSKVPISTSSMTMPPRSSRGFRRRPAWAIPTCRWYSASPNCGLRSTASAPTIWACKSTDIATALNTLVAGQLVSSFPSGGEEYDVRLRADSKYRTSVEGLSQLIVFSTNKQGWVPLDQVVRIKGGSAPSSISRLDRQRQVTISANVLPGGSQQQVINTMNDVIKDIHLDPGYSTTTLGGFSKNLAQSAYYFGLAIALTFIFMYIVLAAQFESFLHPFTILLTLPLAVPFGILSLVLAGQTINVFSALGMLLLFGIVKKNAILQIDHTNGLRAKGLDRYEAIIQANRDRLRPILMTTAALVVGMLPLIISTGDGAATNRSIGALVAGGQTFCLLLTLLAVPVFYSYFDDMKHMRLFQKLFGWIPRIGRRPLPAIPQPVHFGTGDHA